MRFRFMLPFPGDASGGDAGAAPGSAPALVGEGGQIVVMPGTGAALPDNRSAVERASDAARASIAANGTALKEPGAAQPRANDGTFQPKPEPQTGEKTPEQIEADRVAAEANAGKTPEEIEAERVAALEARTPEEIEADEQAEAEATERRVTLKVADVETPIEFDDPAIAAQFREALQIADQADEIVTRAERQIEEVMDVRNAVEIDPVGFVIGEIGGDTAAVEHLVLSLVTDPAHAALLDKLKPLLTDPNALRLTAAEQKAARGEYRETASHRVAEQATIRQNLKDVQTVVRAIVPSTITPELQAVAYHDMMMDLKAYAERNKLLTLPVEDIPMLLSRRLTALGADPVAAAKLANEAINRAPSRASARGVAPNRVRSAKTGAPTGTPTVPAARPATPKTGKAFVASAASRKAVVVPGSGAGSPTGTSTLTPPRNPDGSKMTIAETTAWHRQRLGKGVKSY
jgi:hypothetical protein